MYNDQQEPFDDDDMIRNWMNTEPSNSRFDDESLKNYKEDIDGKSDF